MLWHDQVQNTGQWL